MYHQNLFDLYFNPSSRREGKAFLFLYLYVCKFCVMRPFNTPQFLHWTTIHFIEIKTSVPFYLPFFRSVFHHLHPPPPPNQGPFPRSNSRLVLFMYSIEELLIRRLVYNVQPGRVNDTNHKVKTRRTNRECLSLLRTEIDNIIYLTLHRSSPLTRLIFYQ